MLGWLVQEMHGIPDAADLAYKFVFSYFLRTIEPKTIRGLFGLWEVAGSVVLV